MRLRVTLYDVLHLPEHRGWVIAMAVLAATMPPRPAPAALEAPASAPASTATSIYLPDSAAAAEKLRVAGNLEKAGDWARAAETYQELLENFQDKVVAGEDVGAETAGYVSVPQRVTELLCRWPAEGIAVYRGRYEPTAQAMLAAADPTVPSSLMRVAGRYFLTPSGTAAALQTLDLYWSRGQLTEAARLINVLLRLHPGIEPQRPLLLYQLALARHLEGDDAAASRALDQLRARYPAAQASLAGQSAPLLTDLAAQLGQPVQRRQMALAGWPMLGGSPARADVPAAMAHVNARLYSVPLVLPQAAPVPAPPMLRAPALEIAPVTGGGELFFSDGNRIGGVRLDSGDKLPNWPEVWITASQDHQPGGLQALAVTDRWLFAVTGATTAPVWLRAMGQATETASICRIDRQTGAITRRFSPGVLRQPGLRSIQFTSAPLVSGGNVYVAARGGKSAQLDDAYLLCLDQASLELQWITYLVSGPSGANFMSDGDAINLAFASPQFSMSGGRLIVSTNLGAVAAIDASSGAIAWLRTYERKSEPAAAFNLNLMPPRTAASPRPAWSDSPPILAQGRAFVLPSDGRALLILDAETGQLQKRLPLSAADDATCLVAVDGEQMILAGAQAAWCVNWKTLASDGRNLADATDWNMRFTPGSLRGRPFLTTDSLYIATDQRLFRIGRGKWKIEEAYPVASAGWPRNEGPGNLLVTPDHVVVASANRLNVYASLAAAQQQLQAQAQADPASPDPLLRLAELALASGDYGGALAWLEKAQPLSESRSAPAERLHATASQTWRELAKKDDASRPFAARFLDLAKLTAHTPLQRVTLWMAIADAASAKGDAAGVLEACDHVLADESARAVLVPYHGRSMQPAWLQCHEVIKQLIRSQGPAVYATCETQAQARFAQARAARDGAALLRAARQWPNASGAPTAALDAARLLGSARQFGAAAEVLRDALRLYSDTPLAAALLEETARNYALMPGRLPAAASRLRLGAETLGDPQLRQAITLPAGTVPVGTPFSAAAAIIQKAYRTANNAALPDFALAVGAANPFGPEQTLTGVRSFLTVEPHESRDDILPLVNTDRTLSLWRPGAAEPLARLRLGTAAPDGGCWLEQTLFAWSRDALVAVDTPVGKAKWLLPIASLPPRPPALELTDDSPSLKAPASGGAAAPVFPQGVLNFAVNDGDDRVGLAGAEQVLAADSAGSHLVIATTHGRIAALDPASGKLQWQVSLRDCIPKALFARGDYCVISFTERSPLQLAAVDNATGQLVYRIARAPGLRLLNFDLAEDGRLVFTLPGHLCARDLFDTGDGLAFDVSPSPTDALDEMVFPLQLRVLCDRILAIASNGTQLRSFSLQTGKPLPIPQLDGAADSVPTFSTDIATLIVVSEPSVCTCSRAGVAAYNLETPQQPQRRLPRDARDIRFFALGQQHLLLFDAPVPLAAPGARENNPFAVGSPPAAGGVTRTMRMLAYSRALAASGEVGRLDILYDFNDPSGIATCNAVDGGVVYITGAAVLHYLPGAAHVPASSPSAQAPAPGETLRPIDTVPSTKSDGLQPESMP